MSPFEQALVDSVLAHRIDLFRLEAHIRAQVLDDLDKLGRELEAQARVADLTAYSKARIETLLAQVTDTIDRYYEQAQARAEDVLPGIARSQAQLFSGELVGAGVDASLPSEAFLRRVASNVLIQGAPSADWWSRQSEDLRFRFASTVRQGLLAGETNEQIVRRIVGNPLQPGIMTTARHNVRALVHSSVQAVANAASLESFRKNADIITGLRQLSTLDSHTTAICMAYAGQEWDLTSLKPLPGSVLPFNGGPPRHWNCRSVLVPITRSFRDMGLPIKEFPKADTSFASFLKRKGVDWQNEILGPGRAELWRAGKITLQQLVDLRGNPLTLAQLEAKYGGP